MSVRLTISVRQQIVSAMMSRRFKAEVEEQWPLWADLASRVYSALYPLQEQKKMQALQDGWLQERDNIGAQIGGSVTRILFNGVLADCHRTLVAGLDRPKAVTRRFQARHPEYGFPLIIDATDPIGIEHDRLLAAHKDLRDRLRSANSKVEAALNSYSTSGALVRDWPEALPYLPTAARPPQQVAIRREDLNHLLGLPALEEVAQ